MLLHAMRALNVSCHVVHCALQARNFYYKSVAIMLSTFEELLFLDSDNIAVQNPEVLFSNERYKTAHCLFWKDFWDADWAPDAPEILGVAEDRMPAYSLESGQMLLHKGKCAFNVLLTVTLIAGTSCYRFSGQLAVVLPVVRGQVLAVV